MKHTRWAPAGSITPDGFLVTGGRTPGLHRTTEYYNGAEWKDGPDMPIGMESHCQVTIGSTVYVSGPYIFLIL